MKGEDEMMADEEEEEDSDEDFDEDSDEDSDESREKRRRGGCRRRGGLVKAACSLQGDGISFTRDCPRNATCDLEGLALEVNGTIVAAKFCKAPEGAEERPCPEDRDGERSGRRGRGGRRGGRRDDDEDDEATEVDVDAANGAPVELRSLGVDGLTDADEAAREVRRGGGADREAADAEAGARGGRREGRRQGGDRRGDRSPTDGDAPEGL